MAKIIFEPLEENDPIFKRGAVCFNPSSIRESLKSRMDSSKPEAPKEIGLTRHKGSAFERQLVRRGISPKALKRGGHYG
jgi:hypothetical protein